MIFSLTQFWEALAEEGVELEEISAPFAPSFISYVRSYHSTLKELRLLPYLWKEETPQSAAAPGTAQQECFDFLDYTALLNHEDSLESLEICNFNGQVTSSTKAWRLEHLAWEYEGVSVIPLLLFTRLTQLFIPIATTKSAARDDIVSDPQYALVDLGVLNVAF